MKQTMRKLTLLSFYKDREVITEKLQELGVIHPEIQHISAADELESLEQKQSQFEKTIDYLRSVVKGEPQRVISSEKTDDSEDVIGEIAGIRKRIDQIRKNIDVLRKQLRQAKPWGEHDKKKIQQLQEKGILFRFYRSKPKEHDRFDFSDHIYFLIERQERQVHFVIIHEAGEEPRLPFEEVELPSLLASEIEKEISGLEIEEKGLNDQLKDYTAYIPLLEKERIKLQNQIEFQKVSHSFESGKDGKILVISGWYPMQIEKKVLDLLEKENITFFTSKPSNVDHVPIELRNNRYIKLFEPITRIFQLPNYREFDLTPFIAVFYPVFFAYCLGDAGYGLVLALASVVAGFTFLRTAKNIAIFGLLLGIFTMVMGIVKSGSILGIPLQSTSEFPLFQYLSQFIVIPDDRNVVFNAFNVALMIGVVQILIGVASSALKSLFYHSYRHALPEAGKFLIISSVILIFLANMQSVELLKPFAPGAKYALFLGIGLVLFFHDLNISFFKRIGSGILPLFFIFTGILGDVLSYVRLFALGVVSSVLGLVVNQIGMQIFSNGWWGIIIGIAFLIFGHSLNLAIAILGSFVHPLRLTFVEFYNNAHFEGGGIPYKPFKKIST